VRKSSPLNKSKKNETKVTHTKKERKKERMTEKRRRRRSH
jgi:hypothetical protein